LAEEVEGVPVERFRYFLPARAENVCYGGGALFNVQGSPWTAAKIPALVGAQYVAIRRRVHSGSYDAVSAHWVLPQGWTAVRGAAGRTPVITTVHGSDVFGLQHPVLARFKRAALRGSAAVTVNSSATAAAVSALVPEVENVRQIPMGVDIDAVAEDSLVQSWRRQTGGGPLVAFVGRLIDWKGAQDLVDAAAILASDWPRLRVVVAGSGPLLSSLRAQARELGIDELVIFPGWLARDQVTALQAAADVVVAPSRTSADGSREAQGLSMIEAMALGRPVVAAGSGGITDAIEDGSSGLLVPERDPQALADAIRRLLGDTELAHRLGDGAANVAKGYSWPHVGKRFVELFEDVVERPPTA
jgi:glycosyltransferase involved in cell wall biosynthesis